MRTCATDTQTHTLTQAAEKTGRAWLEVMEMGYNAAFHWGKLEEDRLSSRTHTHVQTHTRAYNGQHIHTHKHGHTSAGMMECSHTDWVGRLTVVLWDENQGVEKLFLQTKLTITRTQSQRDSKSTGMHIHDYNRHVFI